jgi:hypothetical protein
LEQGADARTATNKIGRVGSPIATRWRGSAAAAAGWLAWAARRIRRVAGPALRVALLLLAELLVVAALVALPALFFWRVLASVPGDQATFPVGDFTELNVPFRHFISDELARGHIPFWNPFIFAGQPTLGDIQFAALYPVGYLFARLAGGGMPLVAVEQQIVAHFALAGVFTYLLGRRLLRTRTGAIVAALVFTYGGYLTSFPIQQMMVLQTSIWLPLILLFLDLAICYRSPTLAIPAGLGLAVAALAGHPQSLFYVCLGAALYFIFRVFDRGFHPVHLVSGLAFVVVGFGIAAPQLIPAYQHLSLTTRDSVTYGFTTPGFSLREMYGFLVPSRFGGQPLYQGILPLVLLGIAVLNRRAGRIRWFWLGLAVVSLLFAFGGNTFLQSLLFLLMPILRFRDHERFSFLISLAVAMLAGIGVDGIMMRAVGRDAIRSYLRAALVVLGFVCALIGLYLYGVITGYPEVRGTFETLADRTILAAIFIALSVVIVAFALRDRLPRAWPILVVALIATDLFTNNWQTNLVNATPAVIIPTTTYTSYLQSQTFGLFRIASEGLMPGDGNAGSLYRLQDIVGNSPLEMESYQLFNKEVGEWQRWRLLNVRFLVTKRDLSQDGRFRLAIKDGDTSVYEIKPEYRLPRAWIVERTVFAASPAAARALTNTIDPLSEAVVEDERVSLAGSGATGGAVGVEVESYTADRIVLSARAARSSLLVLSEVAHPDWVAKVDGVKAPIVTTDGLLRGIALAPGVHNVELTISPPGYASGLDWARQAATVAAALIGLEILGRLLSVALRFALRRLRRANGRRNKAAKLTV